MLRASQVFNRLNFNNLKGDLFGGVTAAIISLPMALAFGVATGLGPIAGLYGAVCVGFMAALFGGTPTLISEPTGPMTVLMTAVVLNFSNTYPDDRPLVLALSFTVVVLAGLFQIGFGLLKLGRYVTMMPYSVISGFMSGIGLILLVLQLPPLLGQTSAKGGVLANVQEIPTFIANASLPELALGAGTIALLVFTPSAWRRWCPPQLLALVLGTVASLMFFGDVDIRRIGEIPVGLPSLYIPTFNQDQMQTMIVDGAILGMLGCIDALLTSTVADSLTRTEHNSDKELIGQGLGNVFSGLFGGLPGAGATMGTVVNIQTGGRTALSGLTRALLLLVVVLWIGPTLASVPLAVLAGIAMKVGFDIVDWSFLKRIHKVSINGALITYAVTALTVFVDLIVAVGVGVFVANILTISRLTDLRSKSVRTIQAITDVDDAVVFSDSEKALLARTEGHILLFHLSGPMIFGVAKAIAREHNEIESYEVLMLDLSDVPWLGVSSGMAIEAAIEEAAELGRRIYIVGCAGPVQKRLKSLNVGKLVPPECWVSDRQQALEAANLWLFENVSMPAADGESSTDSEPQIPATSAI
ncbi:MAG: SulP family inorganic anion transporter [Cyanobacteria bacterium P01_C01_bin.89]